MAAVICAVVAPAVASAYTVCDTATGEQVRAEIRTLGCGQLKNGALIEGALRISIIAASGTSSPAFKVERLDAA